VSQANCKQRKGRAGRVQSGFYFSLLPIEAYNALPEYRPAEILRLPLEDVCLKARATLGPSSVSGNLADLFASALDPPPLKNIDKALSILKQVRALNHDENLTSLGKHLANLGIDVRLGKMILFAVALRCLDPILTIAASLSLGKSPFFRPDDMTEYRRTIAKFKTEDSDLMMIYNAYTWWQTLFDKGEPVNRIYAYCRNNYISFMNLKNIQMAKNQILKTLFDSGLLPRSDDRTLSVPAFYNERSSSTPLVLCTLSACLFPNIIYKAPSKPQDTRPAMFVLGKTIFVNIHTDSLLRNDLPPEAAWFSSHVIKGVKGGSNSAIAMDLNRLSAFGMISLVADDVHVNYLTRCLNLDGKSITIKAFPKSATLMVLFSRLLHKAINARLGITRHHHLEQKESEEIIDVFVSALET
jgi:HrpA-like RNA helicase